MTPLFDAHCHLAPEGDPSETPAPPEPAAVRGRLLCAVEPGEFDRLARAARDWPGTTPAFGVHPWHAGTLGDDWLEQVEAALAGWPAAWLGEIGLDGLKTDRASAARQDEVFRAQLRLARRLDRPVNLHCVKAWDPLVRALDQEYLVDGPRPFVVHAFAGPHQMVDALARRGASFTQGPLAARPNGRKARARAALLPPDRLLLESDAFLVPPRDDAAGLLLTLDWLAAVRGMGREELAAQLAASLF